MSKASEQFLTSFNRIEKWLRSQVEPSERAGFSELVHRLSKERQLPVSSYTDDLLQIAQLRNAIVHDKISTDFVIAEPNQWIVNKIKEIEQALLEPEQVIPHFKKSVTGFEDDTLLADILKIVAEKGYSQFPIYHSGKFLGLITVHGLGIWLAKRSQKEAKISIEGKTAKDLLAEDRRRENYRFIAADDFIFEARAIFQEHTQVETIFITKDGNPNGNLLGIIRPRDIFQMKN